MDFSISREHESFGQHFERFCQDRIAPRAKEASRRGELSKENWQDLKEQGFFQLYVPESWGGVDADWLMRALAEESLAKACASTFLSAGASIGLAGGPIMHFGTDAQKERWLKPLTEGSIVGCFALTEPGCGTDAGALITKARRDGEGWRLSGEKALITNAPIADVAVVMARTDPDAGYGGVTAFVVDLSKEGVTRSAPYEKMGLKASPTGSLTFDNVLLSNDDVIGTEGAGFMQAMQTLEYGRISMSHFGIGIADAAFEASMRYATERKAFGKPISRLQAVHFQIADMKVEIDAARLMARRVAWLKSTGEECRELASVSKLYATEMAVRVANRAVQIHGGWGYTDDFDVSRYLGDARLGPIGEGTSEIQRELIARSLLDQ